MTGLGGFGALFELPTGYKEPVLVSGTDGVGTKLRLALDYNKHDAVGIDLVAMCVNDLIVCGAEPLFFLDYYATGKLDIETAATVVSGIADGCELSGCSLIGGETAEMPGMYEDKDYDLAGFCVGIAEKSKLIDGSKVEVGDTLIGLASSGPHSNGYSIIRKVLEITNTDPTNTKLGGKLLIDLLMEPTKIYVKSLLNLIVRSTVHAIAHITGGGPLLNLQRIVPEHLHLQVELSQKTVPAIFRAAEKFVAPEEMLRTFNMGLGLVLLVAADAVDALVTTLQGEKAFVVGEVSAASQEGGSVEIQWRE